MKDRNYQNLLDNLYEGVYYVDLNRKIKYWSKGAENITGYKSEEVIGTYCGERFLAHTDLDNHPLCETGCLVLQTLLTGTYCKTEAYLKHKKGHRIHVSVRVSPMYDTKGNIIGATQIFTNNDYYLSKKSDEEDESYALYYDKMTRLPTKYNMKLKIKSKIQEFRRYGWKFGLFLLEVDDFVEYKRKFGPEKTDELILTISKILKADLRPFDMLSRWQTNQFMILMVNLKEENLKMLTERLRKTIKKKGIPGVQKNKEMSFSIGATIVSEGITIEEILDKVSKFKNISQENGGDMATINF
ncbi:MAG: GGDEF domain-containing protein [Candidatus Cloacimonetes bacterium]|nr:GGDEF domain-containing protein [Candidatus Cloacimonadota bacterium]